MNIKGKDLKLLWGRSGNRCALCRRELTQDVTAVTAAYTLGEQAHIVGEKADARDSLLSEQERNSYHNLVLLCPNHHTEIDKNVDDWPIEKLHQAKSEHELWVTETLSETINHVTMAHQAIVSAIVDAAVEKCELEEWQAWTSWALAPIQQWSQAKPDAIFQFRQLVVAAVWPPGFDELRRSATTLSILLHRASEEFLTHSDLSGETFRTDRFYQRPSHNPNYHADLEAFTDWQERCYEFIREATKAANWFADVVRRDVNPMFFAIQGRFLIMEGPFMPDMGYRSRLLEYSSEERLALPNALQ